jgi:hypothetical protein
MTQPNVNSNLGANFTVAGLVLGIHPLPMFNSAAPASGKSR